MDTPDRHRIERHARRIEELRLWRNACERPVEEWGFAAGDGEPRIVDGDMPSIMAGLCCGEPNILGWDILRNHVSAFVSCPDWVTARGMRTLGAPEKGDPRVISGESGAVTTGLVETIMLDPEYAELKDYLGLDKTSSVLCFSTEGDTDPEQYRRIVWEGEYPTC